MVTTPSDPFGGILAALGDLYGGEAVLARAHSLFAEDPTVIADLRYEVADLAAQLTAAKTREARTYRRVIELDARLVEARRQGPGVREASEGIDAISELALVRNTYVDGRPDGQPTCDQWTATGDIRCELEPGHYGSHAGGHPPVAWRDQPLVEAAIVCGRSYESPHGWTSECDLLDGHPGRHTGKVAFG